MFHKLLTRLPTGIKKWLKEVSNIIPNSIYIRLSYFLNFGKILSLRHPRTYTEKIQRLKLHQTSDKYARMVDKYTVRFFAQEKVGEDIAVPLYRHGTDPEKIPFGTLPNSFVIKCNHGSKYNIFVYDKKEIDETAIKQQLKTWLAIDFRKISRELQYKGIQKQICIEQLLQDENGVVPYDYKCYCFQGVPRYINVSIDRFTNLCIDFYDTQRNKQSFYCKQISTQQTKKPTQLAKMLDYATKLSAGIPFVRVDFYQLNNKVYLGEMTLTPDAGHGRFYPDHQKIDKMFGDLIHLPHHFN